MDKNTPINPLTEPLAKMREKIDTLDKAMRDILYQRTQIVAEIAALKQEDKSGILPIRPQREAAQWAELVAHAREHRQVPLATLAAIWRETIGASLAQQSNIAIYADADVLALARAYFGAAVTYCDEEISAPLVRVVSPAQAICPDDESYFVFMRLPLMGTGCAFCYGRVPIEAGSDDVTLIRIPKTKGDKQGECIAETDDFYFCEIAGNASRADVSEKYNADWLGVYPRPLMIEDRL